MCNLDNPILPFLIHRYSYKSNRISRLHRTDSGITSIVTSPRLCYNIDHRGGAAKLPLEEKVKDESVPA